MVKYSISSGLRLADILVSLIKRCPTLTPSPSGNVLAGRAHPMTEFLLMRQASPAWKPDASRDFDCPVSFSSLNIQMFIPSFLEIAVNRHCKVNGSIRPRFLTEFYLSEFCSGSQRLRRLTPARLRSSSPAGGSRPS
jgi:hypothetical protein